MLVNIFELFQVFNIVNSNIYTSYEDYNLCIPCHIWLKYNYQLKHHFEPTSNDSCIDNKFTIILYNKLEAEAWY